MFAYLLITFSIISGRWGGCASSRLDRGLQILPGDCASSRLDDPAASTASPVYMKMKSHGPSVLRALDLITNLKLHDQPASKMLV